MGRFGPHRAGTPRRWCQVCRRRFTPVAQVRRVTPAQAERMPAGLRERLSPCAGARARKVSRDTMRRPLTQRPTPAG